MKKYIRLLRLQDQYIPAFAAISAGVYLSSRSLSILWWAIAGTFLSFTAFIINEMTDQQDTDKYSWNPVHSLYREKWNMNIVWTMFFVFSVAGLIISYLVGLFIWGLAIYLIGILYSLKPIRLKGRIVFDVAAQLLVWWILPFLAPVWTAGDHVRGVWFTAIMGFIIWFAFYPYQISDLPADRKAGLRNTHVVLGVQKSLQLGCILGVVGSILYIWFGLGRSFPSTLPLMGIAMMELYFYSCWMRAGSETASLALMRRDIPAFKIIGQFLVPYILLVWLGIIRL